MAPPRSVCALLAAVAAVAVVTVMLVGENNPSVSEHVLVSASMGDEELLSILADPIGQVERCKHPLSKEDLHDNINSLLAYSMAQNAETLKHSDSVPTLQVIKDLEVKLRRAHGHLSRCTGTLYEKAFDEVFKVAAVAEKQFVDQKKKGKGTKTGGRRGEKEGFNGLPRYLLTHLDNALRCKVGGVVSSRQAKTRSEDGMSYEIGTKYALDAGRLGLTGFPAIFDKWAVPVWKYEKEYQAVAAASPEGAQCHGCIKFRATMHSAYGPRWPEFDLACHKLVPFETTGYCECADGFYPPRLHKGHLAQSCSQVCYNTDFKTMKARPVKVSLRVKTGMIEGGESKMSPQVSFGSDSTKYDLEHLPDKGDKVTYEFQMESDESVKDMHVVLHATSDDSWYYDTFDMAVNQAHTKVKFTSLGARRSFLVAKPYPPAINFGGNAYGDSLTLDPFTTTVTVTVVTGDVPHAIPKAGKEPDFYVTGTKSNGRWWYGGQLNLTGSMGNINGDAKGTATSTTIRHDIGDVIEVKIKPRKKGPWFMKHVKVLTETSHPGHRHEEHKMHPGSYWIAPKPWKRSAWYSHNKRLKQIIMQIERPPAKWDGRTCGGTAAPKSKCKFPFIHEGKTYHSCTTAGKSKFERWCATTQPGTWAYCDCDRFTTWKGVTGPGKKCALPFKANNKWHYDCIPATTLSNDLEYPCFTSPTGKCGGDYPSGVCSVDSLYEGRWAGCQPRGQVPTVAQTKRYTNGQGTAAAGKPCVIPFFYKGQWVNDCIGDAYGGHGWCSTVAVLTKKSTWGGCRPAMPTKHRYIRFPDDVTKYQGHNSAPDDKCVFPFRYKGGTYYDCKERSDDLPHGWCSLDADFKNRWGACAHDGYKPAEPAKGARWTNGTGTVEHYTPCRFPFYYRGSKYTSCVGRAPGKPNGWCSATENWSNRWGDCMAPGSGPPSQDCKLTPWSPWTRGDVATTGSCTGADPCVGHTQRVRSILQPAKNGGKPCSTLPTLRLQKQSCHVSDECTKELTGTVSNSLTGRPISNANVSTSCEGGMWTATDVDGSYHINHVPNQDCQVSFVAQGFVPISMSVHIDNGRAKVVKNLSLRPVPVGEPDVLSLTLNWDQTPSDLDAHMLFTPFIKGTDTPVAPKPNEFGEVMQTHFYWIDKGDKAKAPFVTLDHDEMSGRGPETVSIHKMIDGLYHFYAKCYSCPPVMLGLGSFGASASTFPTAEATVTVTQGAQQVQLPLVGTGTTSQYRQARDATGKPTIIWDVITIKVRDGHVQLEPHLKYDEHEPTSASEISGDHLATPAPAEADASSTGYGAGRRRRTSAAGGTDIDAQAATLRHMLPTIVEATPAPSEPLPADILRHLVPSNADAAYASAASATYASAASDEPVPAHILQHLTSPNAEASSDEPAPIVGGGLGAPTPAPSDEPVPTFSAGHVLPSTVDATPAPSDETPSVLLEEADEPMQSMDETDYVEEVAQFDADVARIGAESAWEMEGHQAREDFEEIKSQIKASEEIEDEV